MYDNDNKCSMKYIFFRVLLMCQQNTSGISDAQLSSVLPDIDTAARVSSVNKLLKTVSFRNGTDPE